MGYGKRVTWMRIDKIYPPGPPAPPGVGMEIDFEGEG